MQSHVTRQVHDEHMLYVVLMPTLDTVLSTQITAQHVSPASQQLMHQGHSIKATALVVQQLHPVSGCWQVTIRSDNTACMYANRPWSRAVDAVLVLAHSSWRCRRHDTSLLGEAVPCDYQQMLPICCPLLYSLGRICPPKRHVL